ncbi:hypothetical protein PoB_003046900 [Plakobranchus ocellatus]|uniref:Uncharacterized protein n=1 Tax=Plakobranchus ocellatus TaxID=259542 RepID=A0AAV4A8L1_9GAST|nr:hypothetical protein PoB_003046900 [Plakobranchus ocellatus]
MKCCEPPEGIIQLSDDEWARSFCPPQDTAGHGKHSANLIQWIAAFNDLRDKGRIINTPEFIVANVNDLSCDFLSQVPSITRKCPCSLCPPSSDLQFVITPRGFQISFTLEFVIF